MDISMFKAVLQIQRRENVTLIQPIDRDDAQVRIWYGARIMRSVIAFSAIAFGQRQLLRNAN